MFWTLLKQPSHKFTNNYFQAYKVKKPLLLTISGNILVSLEAYFRGCFNKRVMVLPVKFTSQEGQAGFGKAKAVEAYGGHEAVYSFCLLKEAR